LVFVLDHNLFNIKKKELIEQFDEIIYENQAMKEVHHLYCHYFETMKIFLLKENFNDEFTVSNKDVDVGC
jgi:hypothetical protein